LQMHGKQSACKVCVVCPHTFFRSVGVLKLDACGPADPTDLGVFLIWTTPQDTFGMRNQWSVESLLKHHPCSPVVVYSNTLPLDFFSTLSSVGFRIGVSRYVTTPGAPHSVIPSVSFPGAKWFGDAPLKWAHSPFFPVHMSDMLRMAILYSSGGT
jgi:hypothetical protein